jgi:DNA-binding CsgD family transcriptional regulator
MQSKPADRSGFEPASEPREESLAALAEALMSRARETPLPAIDDGTRVLMDVESDGIRCVLVRTESTEPPPALLSPRELEIARMIALGLPNKTIAAVLEISAWTVGTYLRRIFAKLHVTSRAAMVAKLAKR